MQLKLQSEYHVSLKSPELAACSGGASVRDFQKASLESCGTSSRRAEESVEGEGEELRLQQQQ